MNSGLATLDAYAQWDGCDLELAVSEIGLLQIMNVLRGGGGAFSLMVGLCLSGCASLRRLEVRPVIGALLLNVNGDVAVLSGDQESLLLLAENFEFLRLQWSRGGEQHLHLDPSSNSFLLSPDSEALVVIKKV